MKKVYLLFPFIFFSIALFAQSTTFTGSIYNQDFNTLTNSGTSSTLPTGWFLSETGTNANTTYTAGTGASNAGDSYSFGAASSTERALGGLQSGSLVPAFGVYFTNNSGSTITSLIITYTGEQWRLGTAGRADRIDFQFSTDATSITTGIWTDVDQLDFSSPVTTGTVGVLDGNATANKTSISYTITGLSIANGATFFFRWTDFNATGSDDALSVDDFSLSIPSGADIAPPTVTTLSPANNATNVSIHTQLQIVFNESIQKGTGNIFIKRFSDNAVVQTIDVATGSVTVSNNTATISINTLANSIAYYIEVDAGAFKDVAGNNFTGISGNASWKFETQGADVTPPAVTSLSPPNNATGVAPNTSLQIIFNENIQKGTSGNIILRNFSDNSIVQTISVTSANVTVSNATATITINPLSFSTTYYVEVDAGSFKDLAGNNFPGITGNSPWKFTTDQQPATGVIGTNYNFNNCTAYYAQGFRQYSVTGAEIWSCTKFGRTFTTDPSTDSALQMNGFNVTSKDNEDWFISPAFNLSGATSPYVRFHSRNKFAGNNLVLKVSTNYPGYGNPNSFTWTTIDGKFPAANTDVWTLSDSIYLTSFLAPSVHIAWVYTSTTAAAARWTLDDIKVSVGCTPPAAQPTALTLTPTIISINGSFTAASAPADAYLVIMSTSSTLNSQPTPGTVYAVDDVIGNGTVVSAGNNLSFTVNNLNPSTQYYFFVYAYVGAQSCYNTTTPLTGSVSTNASPTCTPPTVQATNLNGTVTGASINLTYTRGNGDNILIVARKNGAVNQNPIVGVNYPAGSEIGSGNFVIYNGPASNFNYTSLTQNTIYHFALYEYFNTNYCYNLTALTGNFTTSCIIPVNVSSLNAVAGNAVVNITWTNPTASCYDEILVVASNAPITGQGSDYAGNANSVYTGPNQVVFRGTGTSVSVTGLVNGTTYYFKVFTKKGSAYSGGVTISATPFDPASGFVYMYGNLHSHSSYSDGNKDDPSKKPIDDYLFARDANCMDFLGISEHNHSGAGMSISNYPKGYADANAVNGVVSPTTGNSLITLWGMEWGVISNGGHVLVYGFDDQLIGWEPGNYNIFVAKNDYASLFNLINAQPNAFATLAHPDWDPSRVSSEFGNIANTPHNISADNAIAGTAIESGPAFSTDTTYSNFPSQLADFGYYKYMLSKGYRLGPTMDGDNHNMTFGKQSANRLVVLAAAKTRIDLVAGIKAMRFYASNDCNVKVDFKISSTVMGGKLSQRDLPNVIINITDADPLDIVDSVYIYGAKIGDPAPAQPIKKYFNVSSVTFNSADVENIQPNNTEWYYFVLIKQQDGNKIVTSPIWYTRNDAASLITDHFRTKQSGNWNDVNTWESSPDNSTWSAATITPDFNSNTITIQPPHVVTATAHVTIDQTTILGVVVIDPNVVLTVNNGTGTDVSVISLSGLQIRSTAAGTGSIGKSTGNISGNILFDRYISNRRAWRSLGIPFSVSPLTIYRSWMNDGSSSPAGLGTQITTFSGDSRASNFDGQKPASSIRTYVNDNFNSDVAHTPNTTDNLAANQAYFLFVRGDRAIDRTTSGAASSETTLRAYGTPNQGNFIKGVTGTNFSLIPNPYPSHLNFDSIKAIPGNASINTFYVWDATLGTVGQYRTVQVSGTAPAYTYTATPGSANNNWRYIESGTAFMIPGSRTVEFTEATKTAGTPPASMLRVNAGTDTELAVNFNKLNSDNTVSLADGIRVVYNNAYSPAIDNDDAKKVTGFELNFGITAPGDGVLSIEKRPMPVQDDVILLNLSNTAPGNYQFEVTPANFPASVTVAYLKDHYLDTYTPISLTAATNINFSISADAGSTAANRFSIVFNKDAVSPARNSIVVYPNPVQNGIVSLRFTDLPKGMYSVRLINALGQAVVNQRIEHAGGSSVKRVNLNKMSGVYMIEVVKPDNTKWFHKVIVN